MEQEFYFQKDNFNSILNNLLSTQKSIGNAASQFIEYCNQNLAKEAVEEWYKVAKDFMNLGEEQKLINLMFLYNDVNQKYKEKTDLQDNFKIVLEELIKGLIDTPLNKMKNQCKKIFDIQIQRGVFQDETFLQKLIDILNQENILGSQEKLSENLPHPPAEFLQLISNEGQYHGFKAKVTSQETKTEQETKKLNELQSKYCQLTLKNYKEIIQLIDKQHMKSVVEYKLLMQKIEKIQQIQQDRIDNPSLLNNLPQTVIKE